MVLKKNSVELIAAGLGDDGDGRAAGHPLFGIEIIGGNVDFLNGFRWRHVHSMVRQPDEHIRGTVDASVVVVPIRAVDVRAQGAFRRIGNRVLENSRRRARHKIDERLVIAVLIERHV